jgi:hypothetical protein
MNARKLLGPEAIAPLWLCCTLILALMVGGITSTPASAQQMSIFDKLSEQEKPILLTIATDLETLINERKGEDPLSAMLTFSDAGKQKFSLGIEVSSRGKFRRRKCDFPPLRLDFPRKLLQEQGFQPEFRKLKLVTHCLDSQLESQDNILKEYLAYRIYNELTSYSFRAQLVRIDYIDTEKKVRKIRRYGIILEDMDELAMRLGGEECKNCYGVPAEDMDAALENIMCVFQYMLGNTDWSIAMVRNIKLLTPAGGGRYITIPYDFDFSGFVAPSYATPDANYGLTSTKQRVFLGREHSWPEFAKTIALFVEKKPAILQMVQRAKLLSLEARQECIGYLESFYREIEALLDSQGGAYPGPFTQREEE